MKISIIIPAYNEASRIAGCLSAVEKSLKKIDVLAEVIVVNNSSTDKTKEIASSFSGVKVVDEPKKGIVWARRAGFLASTGDLLANVDADTLMPESWLEKVFREFERDPKLLALSGPYIYYDAPFSTRLTTKVFYFFGFIGDKINKLLSGSGSMLQGGNFVLRREALEKIGGYDTSIEFYGEDSDIGRRVGKIGKVKWTWSLPMYSSGRRFNAEGLFATGTRYCLNFLWITFKGKPFTYEYKDIRPD